MSPQDPTPQIGRGLKSKTSHIQEFPIGKFLDGYDVILVDMPGFDDTYKDSITILIQVVTWLDELCQAKKELSGIIHLHRISDNRVSGSGVYALKLLESIMGEAGTKNIMLVANRWRGGEEEEEEATAYKELKEDEDFWAPLICNGAKTDRYGFYTSKSLESEASAKEKAREAARRIIAEVLKNNVEITQFERETVEDHKPYGETAICSTVRSHLFGWENAVEKKVKSADETADKYKETDPERSARFREKANEARREKERIRRQWALLAKFLNGLGYLLGALAGKFGSKLMRDGVLCTFEVLAQYAEGNSLDIESHPGLDT
ncbi:hypothetical protein TWF225_007708 [Orbilia oligospora]|nr:hypothetical protein TWF225_007708 [Orbilia oligospora]KAF3180592.1 hypothetical protein TWF751_010970 [Orbilia oligospora]KAF3261886.1 hypothetical protein TWF217_004444 [Orbilia oligospora]KAF3265939.1 hypothetical protein TWF128_011513 [Orbilia oligospora]KAF3290335.1 hypothetical protein TWF132_007123 [Orbilia oligospora]